MQGATAASRGDSRVVVSASIAYDYIMAFPGSFGDHILPDKTHVLSVSFLVNSMKRQRGGVAGNIAYSLALLGERPMVAGAGGADFGPYRDAFEELGIDLSLVMDVPSELTASAFMMTDLKDNQIAAFYPGAGGHIEALSIADAAASVPYGLVGATMPEAMRRHAHEIAAAGSRLIYDPSQQIVALSAEDLVAGIDDAWALIGNDYELAMIERKTGLSIDALKERVPLLVVTFGDQGSEFFSNGASVRIPAAKTDEVRDPTGAGDAFRAGMVKGLLLETPFEVTGRIASLAATHAVEHHGTQEHHYSSDQFVERFERVYPDYRGAIKAEHFRA